MLSICIPTYNRDQTVKRNILHIFEILAKNGLEDLVSINVSDNNSQDKTSDVLDEILNTYTPKFHFRVHHHTRKLKIQDNLIYVAAMSKTEKFMWLGDDDFFSEDYLLKVIELITTDKNVSGIIPAFKEVGISGEELSGSRDLGKESKIYSPGFATCLKMSWRGHQMSGLVFDRHILEYYQKNEVSNMYPFIFFAAFASLHGHIFHLTEFPIEVTQPGQEKKDWGYDQDGLFNEVFDNYSKLEVGMLRKTLLQLYFYYQQFGRLLAYKRNGFRGVMKAYIKVEFSKNGTFLFKICFPLFAVTHIIFLKIREYLK
ncbi:putative Glycosyl transferase family 2 [Marinoscillum sp. 108]|nr:putative Glycosyl transferase family 2 [Marinoscillum sp. 108]